GALFFKSNMTLFLEKGAVLKGSTDLVDYPIVRARFEGTEGDQYASLINGGTLCGEGIQNFSIRGEGIIDAEGEKRYKLEMAETKGDRGSILDIMNGEHLYFAGVTFFESPALGVQFLYCSGLTLENVPINTRHYIHTNERYQVSNVDGLVISSS